MRYDVKLKARKGIRHMKFTQLKNKLENRISCCIYNFIRKHPFAGSVLSIVGTSILIIAFVGICTAIFVVVINHAAWFFKS